MTQKKQQLDWRLAAIAIVCLTGYGVFSASKGINGHLMALIVGIIALIVGVKIPDFIKSR